RPQPSTAPGRSDWRCRRFLPMILAAAVSLSRRALFFTGRREGWQMATSALSSPRVEVVAHMAEVAADAWDRCANGEGATFNPFVAHGFLKALEESGSVGGRSGWVPRHLLLFSGEEIVGCAPCYLKSHSQGEYVFDHSWAEAYANAGGRYYPKLQIAVP